ncbi:MFS quinate transporter [Aspergillus luchuensis]|uniref:MFS quinate transporter n=1 Tax=Aspergillus kawachii TaxID=1069201 RepID=A0A146FSM1_ASPKA|nr:MFS quinate transporter [Aspergillus luchuensis]
MAEWSKALHSTPGKTSGSCPSFEHTEYDRGILKADYGARMHHAETE